MKFYNTLTRKKEEFVPLEEGKVKMYVCGPTVYNFIHIGNARPMIVFDTARRYMEYRGYEVNFVSNFTDVDDKIIKKAIEEGVEASVISERYIAECKKDMAGMNVKDFWSFIKANETLDKLLKYSENPSVFLGSIIGYIDYNTWLRLDKQKLWEIECSNKADNDPHKQRFLHKKWY